MARFPVYESNIKALGELLARAATDPAFKRRFQQNPRQELRKAGLPEQTIELFTFQVVDEAVLEKPPVILPYRLNDERLQQKDPGYLAGVAEMFPPRPVS